MTTNTSKFARVVLRPPIPFSVIAERTTLSVDGRNDRTKEETAFLHLSQDSGGNPIAWLTLGQLTASFALTPENVQILHTRSWVACQGVRGGADRIVIPSVWLVAFFSAQGIYVVDEEVAA